MSNSKVFTVKNRLFSKLLSALFIASFAFCLVNGFSQSVTELVLGTAPNSGCCAPTSGCHPDSSTDNTPSNGLCSAEELSFKQDSDTHSEIVDTSPKTTSPSNHTPTPAFTIHGPGQSSTSSTELPPPFYIFIYPPNAPPTV